MAKDRIGTLIEKRLLRIMIDVGYPMTTKQINQHESETTQSTLHRLKNMMNAGMITSTRIGNKFVWSLKEEHPND